MKASLTVKCSHQAQEEIRIFLANYLKDLPLSGSEQNQIILAVDEAVANAIEHGGNIDENRSIELYVDVSENRIAFELNDIGMFDVRETGKKEKEKDIRDIIKEKQKGGLGLKLIYSIMDIVCFYTKNNKSYCLLVKLLK